MKNSIHLIGNAHLDPIWLWRWQEGCNEVMQTFRSALDRLNEYDDFVFTCSSAAYYKWVEELDPDMFAEIQKMVKNGRWVPVNGWWVQPDCNMPSGESFARQALYSQLYYYEKFGKICRTGYNVDSFGHNAMMPQLLRQGGMCAYVMMRPETRENPNAPEDLFWWDSSDGSRVLTYRITGSYTASGKDSIDEKAEDLLRRAENDGHGMMLFYGVGNHGGGPTRGDIEHLIEKMQTEGYESLKFSSPDEFFRDMLGTPLDIPVWTDDLQHHASGCYSATSLVKQLNRKAENRLAAAEKFNTIAAKTAGAKAETKAFAEAWERVCFNQFHDILCGCSIMEAYEDVKESEGYALDVAARIYNSAVIRIARQIDTWIEGVSDPVCGEVRHLGARRDFPRPIVVFNPLSQPIEMPVRALYDSKRVTDSEGSDVLFQNVRSSRSNDSHLDTLFLAKVPAMGYATYWLYFEDDTAPLTSGLTCEAEPVVAMENDLLRVEFDKATGGIRKLLDKTSGVDYAANDVLAVPTVIDDHKTDTWAHNVFQFHDIKGTMNVTSVECVEQGPLRASVRIKYAFNHSTFTQEFCLTQGKKLLRVKCKANWSEPFTMLKLPFDIGGTDEISTYEIPCGFIKRPCDGDEEPAQQWADVTATDAQGRRIGLAIMNDGKYSYDCPGTQLRLTALRNVIFADHYSHRPAADFNFCDEGLQRFEYAILPHEGEAEESEIMLAAARFNCRPVTVSESYHKGKGEPQVKSFLEISKPNIIVTAFKFSEDKSGAVVLRCFESAGRKTRANLLCDLLDAAFTVDFNPHEIKTFRIDPSGKVFEVNFLEGIVK